jgi:exopolysaccharide biosynthesis polyprenyl glycosylphosphotransferase
MAVAHQPVPGALRAATLSGVGALPHDLSQRALPPRWLVPSLLAAADLVALVFALILTGSRAGIAAAYVPAAIGCLALAGAYRNRMSLRALDAMPWLVGRMATPLLLLAPVAVLTGADSEALLWVALVGTGLVAATRVASYAGLRAARRRGRVLEPAVILGAGQVGAELGRTFRDERELGVEVVGFLDCVDGNLPYPVLGDVDQLGRLLGEFRVRRVIVAFGPAREAELVGVLRTAVAHDADVHIVPRFFDCGVAPQGPDTDDVRGIPLYRVRRAALRAPAWALKRALDITVASTVLVLTTPLLAAIAVAVRLGSPGPVLFKQRRVGQYGREIDVAKFRTLRVHHDSDTQWNVDDDPRMTPVGRILRRTSLDELPQLWSVLKGDMSLVGPRPERPFFVRRFSVDIDGYGDRHRLPVGLTGWAQVNGLRGDTSIEERARFDNSYIEHWSLWRDLVILVRTVAEVVRGSGTRTD